MAKRRVKKAQVKSLVDVLADEIRSNRERLGWTQDELAEQMTLLGLNWNRVTVAEAEGRGRGRRVSIEELLALAMTFGVGVVHLLAQSGIRTQVTEKVTLEPAQVRAVMTVGHGSAAPPELRRMQLEFRREQALGHLEVVQAKNSMAQLDVAAAQRELDLLEAELSDLGGEEQAR